MLSGHRVTVDDEVAIFALCKYMGWTYQEYMAQPTWFLQTAIIYLTEENNAKEKNVR